MPGLYALVTGLLLVAAANSAPQKAPRFKACERKQPADKLNQCLRDSLQKAVPELVKGLPNYGLLTLDPLRVDVLQIPQGKGAMQVDLTFNNLDIFGLGNAKIVSVEGDVDKYQMKAKIEIDGNISLLGDYKVDGKVLVLPVQGTGKCNITLVRPKGEITEMLGKPFTKNGKQYVRIVNLKFIVASTERVYFNLQNLFNGNKVLGDNMNLVLNDNWKEIFEDMVGPVQTALGLAFKNIADGVARQVPYDTIFP